MDNNMAELQLTEGEKNLILFLREKHESKKIVKVGYLKEDLYNYDYYLTSEIHSPYYTKEQRDKLVSDYEKLFKLCFKQGAKFFCRLMFRSNNEEWSSENFEFAGDELWAKTYLENITEV